MVNSTAGEAFSRVPWALRAPPNANFLNHNVANIFQDHTFSGGGFMNREGSWMEELRVANAIPFFFNEVIADLSFPLFGPNNYHITAIVV